jgi:deoxyribonuclease V
LILNIPSVGCAKSRLWGRHEDVGGERGCAVPLVDGEKKIGYVLRTRKNVKPVYVSPGHLLGFDEAVSLVLRATNGYRLPEPIREAHRRVNELRRAYAIS